MDNEQSWPAISRGSGIRASDADRERISELLRHHHLEGRLDTLEFQDRLELCLQAKTLGELRVLAADLPAEEPRRTGWAIPAGLAPRVRWIAIAAILLTGLIVASAFAERPIFFPAVPFVFLSLRLLWGHGGRHRRAMLDGRNGRMLP